MTMTMTKRIRHFVHEKSHLNLPRTEFRIGGERSTNGPIRDTPWSDIHSRFKGYFPLV
jgi:hypothetical protein